MDMTAFFSPLEFNPLLEPKDYFIGRYGFTIPGVYEMLKNAKDYKSILSYLYRLRDTALSVKNEIIYHIDNKTDLTKIDLNIIKEPILKIILGNLEDDIFGLRNEFEEFIPWLNKIIMKLEIQNSLVMEEETAETTKDKKINKFIWASKLEDLVAVIERLYEEGFLILNARTKYKQIANFFVLHDGEDIDPKQLPDIKNNIVNKYETHRISPNLRKITFDYHQIKKSQEQSK